MTNLLKTQPFAVFSLVTIALSIGAYLLPVPRELVPVLMVLVPALVAVGLAGLTEGSAGVLALLGKLGRWRLRLGWVLTAILLALALRLAIALLGVALGITPSIQVRSGGPALAVLAVVLFVFAVPEELGWRGYALPRLLQRWSPLAASMIIGVLWGGLHLILHLPGMMNAAFPAAPTLFQLIGLSVLITWLYQRAEGNLLVTSLFHGLQSFFVIFNDGLPPAAQAWLMAGVYLAAATVIMFVSRGFAGRHGALRPAAVPPNA